MLSRAIRTQLIHLFRHKQIFRSIHSKFADPTPSKIISQSLFINHDGHMELLAPYHIHRGIKHRRLFFFQRNFISVVFTFIHHAARIDLSI